MSEKNKKCAIVLITMLTITILFTTAVSAQFDAFDPGDGAGGGDEPSCTPSCGGAECGTVSDGCGGTISCGSCPSGEHCSGGVCVCIPSCSDSSSCCGNRECGTVDDGCGKTYNCGSCPSDGWYCYVGYLASTVRAAKRIYFCDYGYCDYNWDVSTFYDCDNDDGLYCYSGNRIYYRDYGCTADPTKKCTYSESFIEDCDDKDGWYCYADVYRYQDYYCGNGQCGYHITQSTKDGDYSSGACSCLSTGYWNIGGEVSAKTCCGDDANEYRIICKTSGANQGATC